MAENIGVYPLDPSTPVGQVRLLLGDVTATELIPPVDGFHSYTLFSDAEIEAFLAAGGGVVANGVGFAYLSLAGGAASESEVVKDYDLTVDLTKKAADYRALADLWFGRGEEEGGAEIEDAFEIVPTGRSPRGCRPELAPWSFK